MLDPEEVRRFYDRFGALQDRQGFYEDPALDDLAAHAAFGEARAVVELGCGTGRLAERVLDAAPGASYLGLDVSATMVGLSRARLARFGARAEVRQSAPGAVSLPAADASRDRVLCAYVLDLLPEAGVAAFFREARRVLAPRGRLCVVSLTRGEAPLPRLASALWALVFRLSPVLVGGCRPLELRPFCPPADWEVLHRRVVAAWAIPSEVLVARPR